MVSFPVHIAGGSEEQYLLALNNGQTGASPGEQPERIETEAFTVVASDVDVQVVSQAGAVLAVITPFGPDLGDDSQTQLTVIETGLTYTWLRYSTGGDMWSREVDVEIDQLGQIRLTHRLQHGHIGDTWTPDFGFDVSAPGAQAVEEGVADAPVHFMEMDASSTFAEHPELVQSVTLVDESVLSVANPLALRQNRGTFEITADDGMLRLRSNRNEPIEDIESEGLMIQEGQWRLSQLLLAPVSADELARRCDAPLRTHAHWSLYDAVYHTGRPLETETALLIQVAEKYIERMHGMSRTGDDWGLMDQSVRLNHCLYLWEDYFRTGDARLYDMAMGWCENQRNFTVYWGPNEESYGLSRRSRAWRDRDTFGPGSYDVRFADRTEGWLTKGFASFWLAYEESGDPRFRDTAETQARQGQQGITCLKNEMRSVGIVADYAKLFDYTGDEFYLEQALRLWDEFQQGQLENLLFTQHGREEATGDHLYIGNDRFGYQHPFVKPYMVQYATNSLPYLLKHTPDDEHLRDTLLALNDWMATHRQPGGGWGYPHYLTAKMSWNYEYCRGIMHAMMIEPRQIYLDAIRENIASIVQLYDIYGEVAAGLNPWEFAAGINQPQRQEMYELASDRDVMRDYEEGAVNFGAVYSRGPDHPVYFTVLLRDYLQLASEDSLSESWEILDRIKQLPTNRDPEIVLPESLELAPHASFTLGVSYKLDDPAPARVSLTDLPENVTAEPEELTWTVERGFGRSPAFRVSGTPRGEGKMTVHWQMGPWEGQRDVRLLPAEAP